MGRACCWGPPWRGGPGHVPTMSTLKDGPVQVNYETNGHVGKETYESYLNPFAFVYLDLCLNR